MNEEQGVLEPRRHGRRKPAILLGLLPAAIAAAFLLGGAPVPTSHVTELDATLSSGVATAPSGLRTALTYSQFCANPSNPVSTSGTTGKALLYTVNKERAKLGIKPLGWSSTYASIATSWSKKMLSNDLKTSTLIDGLKHNPNRPGAENVAVVYRSTGYTASAALTKMHGNLVRSEGHCRNLMNPKFTYMGSGIAYTTNGRLWYATENFR
jgi:uncharacterized protein YkwD